MNECRAFGCGKEAAVIVMSASKHMNGEFDTWSGQRIPCCLDHIQNFVGMFPFTLIERL